MTEETIPVPDQAVTLSDSTLVLCFADKFLPKTGPKDRAWALSFFSSTVGERELARTVLTVGIASLLAGGKITIASVDHKGLFGHKTRLLVSTTAASDPELEQPRSIEARLLTAAGRTFKEGHNTLSAVIEAVYGSKVENPWAAAIGLDVVGLRELGFYQVETTKKSGVLGKLGKTDQNAVWDVDAITPREPEAHAAWQRYQEWLTTEPLAEQIDKEVGKAIASMREVEYADD